MTTWIRQNGSKINLNDELATIAKAEELGWKREPDTRAESHAPVQVAKTNPTVKK